MPIRLPANMKQKVIRDLSDNESAYTVPWAMSADLNGALYIRADYTAHETPGGTVQMHITKTPYGMIVDTSQCPHYKWTPESLEDHIEWWPVCDLILPQ